MGSSKCVIMLDTVGKGKLNRDASMSERHEADDLQGVIKFETSNKGMYRSDVPTYVAPTSTRDSSF